MKTFEPYKKDYGEKSSENVCYLEWHPVHNVATLWCRVWSILVSRRIWGNQAKDL